MVEKGDCWFSVVRLVYHPYSNLSGLYVTELHSVVGFTVMVKGKSGCIDRP